jgi:hypothetical protein
MSCTAEVKDVVGDGEGEAVPQAEDASTESASRGMSMKQRADCVIEPPLSDSHWPKETHARGVGFTSRGRTSDSS